MQEPIKILLIDDDEVDRMAVTRALQRSGQGVAIIEAAGARQAVRFLRSEAFDCVLLDLHLHDGDGVQLLRDARTWGIKSPFIVLTGQGSEALAVEAMKAGAADYLAKSTTSLEHLWQTIRAAVRIHQAEQKASVADQRLRENNEVLQGLLEREREARTSMAEAQRKLAFLAEASTVLGQSLDYTTTLAAVARLAVPKIADWCSIHMLDADGSIRPLVVAHVDPQKVALAEQLQAKYPPAIHSPTGVPNVLRTGTSELYREIDDRLLSAAATDRKHLQILRQLGLVSAMIVPLVARGRALGAIALVSAESGKHFDADDLLLAEDLARRAAAAVDNAMLYRSVQREKEAAEAANAAKDQFLAMLSHELRTPLTPVLMTIQVLQRDRALPEELRGELDVIRRNVELEARLIDDLLDLTRISKGKLQLDLRTVDAHQSIRDALEICCSEADEKGLKIELDLSARSHFVRADSARLQQVFWNLMKNAIKFTPAGGRVRVQTSNDRSGRLRVAVRDTGIGIEPPALARIFDAFEQGTPAITRQFGGLGLGLAISKALIDMHGGSLSAFSAGKDKGSTFTMTLATVAAAVESRNGDDPRQRESERQHSVRILMVDDHEDTSRALKRLLSRLGYDVLTADSMRAALAAAEAGRFDLLISDIGLPDGSGHELMRQLLARQPIKGIALSGFGMEEDIRKSKEAGFREHLTKPINLAKLQAVIHELVSN